MMLLDAIRDVLMTEWDPLGLAGTPGTSPDYDPYAREVRAILRDPAATAGRVANYLEWVEANILHLQPRLDAATRAADRIMKMKRRFDGERG